MGEAVKVLSLALLCVCAALVLLSVRDRHPPPWSIGHSLILATTPVAASGLFHAR